MLRFVNTLPGQTTNEFGTSFNEVDTLYKLPDCHIMIQHL